MPLRGTLKERTSIHTTLGHKVPQMSSGGFTEWVTSVMSRLRSCCLAGSLGASHQKNFSTFFKLSVYHVADWL